MPGHCLFSIYPVRVLGGILVPVIRDCMIFWGDNFGPRSILCFQPFEKRQLLGTSGVFVCHIRASEDTVAPALRDCLVFPPAHFQPWGLLWRQLLGIVWFLCLSIPGLEGYSIPSCQGSGWSFSVSNSDLRGYSSSALGYHFFLFVNFGLLRLPLSETVWPLCLRISDLRGYSYPAVGQCPIIFVCQ